MPSQPLLKTLRDRVGPIIYPAVRSLGTPPRKVYRHLPHHGVFSLEVEPGVRIRLTAKGQIVENELFWAGFAKTWEHESLTIWREKVRTARTILDIGAHTGIYALIAKAVNPKATVIALEPSPSVAKILRQNIQLNGLAIRVEQVAASDTNGQAVFHDYDGELPYSASLDPKMGGPIKHKVRVARVDDLIEGPVDLVKIDVEMHEPAVLRGMRTILERDRPTMLIEVLTDKVHREIEEALSGLDYRWTRIDDGEEWTNYLLEPESRP